MGSVRPTKKIGIQSQIRDLCRAASSPSSEKFNTNQFNDPRRAARSPSSEQLGTDQSSELRRERWPNEHDQRSQSRIQTSGTTSITRGRISSSTYPTHRCTSPRLPRTLTHLMPSSSAVSAASSSRTTPPGALTLAASPTLRSLTPPPAAATPIPAGNCSTSRLSPYTGLHQREHGPLHASFNFWQECIFGPCCETYLRSNSI
ncbi:hypothetical protein U1Q18_035638 [Sarracenia purpurea var. burkii]